MKHSIGFKILAILLAALALTAALSSALVLILVTQNGLYTQDLNEWKDNIRQDKAYMLAEQVLKRYTAYKLGGCSQTSMDYLGLSYENEDLSQWYNLVPGSWGYTIADESGKVVEYALNATLESDEAFAYTTEMHCQYPLDLLADELDNYDLSASPYRDYYCTDTAEHYLYFFTSPTYTITVRMLPGAIRSYSGLGEYQIRLLFALRYAAIAFLLGGLVVFALAMIYLFCAAGHKRGSDEVRPGGINRTPLDLHMAVSGTGCVLLFALAIYLIEEFFLYMNTTFSPGALALVLVAIFGAALFVVGFLFALAAQVKVPGHFWWKHSILGWFFGKVGRFLRKLFKLLSKFFRLLPLMWQWIVTAIAMVLLPTSCFVLALSTYHFGRFFFVMWTIMFCLADIAMVCYGAYAFGILIRGAKQMKEGDLSAKIPTKYLFGVFREFADHLNALADVATVAAKKQMQSERMKTELITNVSHDIKTPLTNLINYVDLLEKPHTEEEGQQYLAVLSRQSQRLKKLIDDLMDMSKASSGSMSVDITQVDAVEAINQALGEYSDKLDAARLRVIFYQPEEAVAVRADGRLTWRVLSNLLNNIVKYALPGTRVYIDVAKMERYVTVSLKNISAEPLNVSAEELTERFVRGDASRNTEGSGLGLNIAQSLMELQKGKLNLLVDGDLFKVTLIFPTE